MWRTFHTRIKIGACHSRRHLCALCAISGTLEKMHENPKEIVVLYHGGCPDGLGGAYAAWKKFGDTAEYIPAKHGKPLPEGLEGRKLYFIDFSYPQEIMDGVVKTATSVTVLDHHLGTKEIVESMPDFIFDEKRSGATIRSEEHTSELQSRQ